MTAPESDPIAAVAPASGGESSLTVIVAFAANVLIAVAKTVAAVMTGAASMLAEAAHSWADAGNEVFLLIAQRRAAREPDASHPLGYGREIYIWSLFAAIGLFAVGAGVSITHGVQGLINPEPASNFVIAYVVLGVAFVLEGISFLQASRQVKAAAARTDRDVWTHLMRTSDPTVRAVYLEDAAALVGIVIAVAGIAGHQLTGSPVPDAIASILVGILLAVISILLIDRNRRFLVGEVADDRVWNAALAELSAQPEVERVTELRLSLVGAGRVFLSGAVDLVGNADERTASLQLAALERRLTKNPFVVLALISLSAPDDRTLEPHAI
ncbi:MAG TPA: cation diffusion facilitator family transporter [Propionicimonas sp.]|uniref:cation diffusion facilitator family transporter n=1 Tax=Propionicimonas sp. TaxID=1955623 RepID=UPI002F40BE7B